MADMKTDGHRIVGVATCVPSRIFDNERDCSAFPKDEVRKIVGVAGISSRRVSGNLICSSDLCITAADELLKELGWERDSIDALIMVTQSPDYLLPSTCCIVHDRLKLSIRCASFDVGLGCSGYPYGLWLASMMLSGSFKRVLLCHGETPSRFAENSDRSVALLFGDVGSATAIEASVSHTARNWYFSLNTDGAGYSDMIIEAGGFRNRFSEDRQKHHLYMNGAKVFNFTIKRVPPLVEQTLRLSNGTIEDVDYYIFHQSNRFIMKHLAKKMGLPDEKIPMTLNEFGNTGGASIPLTITKGGLVRSPNHSLLLMLLGYGVGLSWGSALIDLNSDTILQHIELDNSKEA
jgi:3-oxoacyl-[acyl-carrier-protein] synthase III